MIRVIVGDLHGQIEALRRVLNEFKTVDEILVAGDFGVGFDNKLDTEFIALSQEIKHSHIPNVKFIRGNHDNPVVLKDWNRMVGEEPGIEYIPDFTMDYETLFIGGAESHDRKYREEGVDWWPGEELTQGHWDLFFENHKPEQLSHVTRIVSHEAPSKYLQASPAFSMMGIRTDSNNVTRKNMDKLLGWLPNLKYWIHGHYHTHQSYRYMGVEFISLPPAHDVPTVSVHINYSIFTHYQEAEDII